eukprot:scaffold6472_cov181-Pinguiococcus_pyrenoidosus.AAC.1
MEYTGPWAFLPSKLSYSAQMAHVLAADALHLRLAHPVETHVARSGLAWSRHSCSCTLVRPI